MFGHSDDQNQKDQQSPKSSKIIEPLADGSLGNNVDDATLVTSDPVGPPPPSDSTPPPPPAEPDDSLAASPAAPALDEPAAPTPPAGSDELLAIKQQALQQLQPLVGHLDQTPDEKFKTTMMMIQATDDQGMLKTAYEAANAIADEKKRAQALLDVVNEINYFTQHNEAA